jgi:hypothetical protein
VKNAVERWSERGNGVEIETGRSVETATSAGGPTAGAVVTSHRLWMTLLAGCVDPNGVIEITHRGVDVTDAAGDVDGVMSIAILHARISRFLLRQHDMSAHLNCVGAEASRARTALAHGVALIGAPAHRTLTCASAIDGTTACTVIATAMISQSILYRLETILLQHTTRGRNSGPQLTDAQ